jgi:zinc and cadmium transporter
MNDLWPILGLSFVGSLASLSGGLILLYTNYAYKLSHFLSAFAAGALLGTAFADLLPEAIEGAGEANIFGWVLAGVLAFFALERFLHWFHHHGPETEGHSEIKPTVALVTIGDAVHNFIDGVVIAGTFMVDPRLGLVTTLAVAAHEIPQEIGDFGVLVHQGVSKARVIALNVLSAVAAIFGATITYFVGHAIEPLLPIFLAITAGFFIYIALADLIPEIHHEDRPGFAAIETGLMLLGVALVWVLVRTLEHGHA